MNHEKELKRVEMNIRETALTMRECNHIGEFAFHAKRLEKQADRLETIRTNISGSGTGND